MIILIDAEMAFDEIQHHLYKNSLESGHARNPDVRWEDR